MHQALDAVLLDLGGTLFYDRPSAWPRVYGRAEAALWKVLRARGVRVSPAGLYGESNSFLEYYYALRGDGLEEPGALSVLHALLASREPKISRETVEPALRAMYAVTQTNWRPERDAAATLSKLLSQGYRLGAVSNGSDHENAIELLNRANLRGSFEIIITSAGHGRRKPDPSIFRAALDCIGIPPQRAAMVGDNYEADILGAHALGLLTIWITRRVQPMPAVVHGVPDATITTLKAISAVLP